MNQQQQEKRKQTWALAISIGLHSLLLLGAYYFLFRTGASYQATTYRVHMGHYPIPEEISQPTQERSPQPPIEKPTEKPTATSPIGTVEPPQQDEQSPTPTPPTPTETNEATSSLEIDQAKQNEEEAAQEPSVDERSLYQENLDKQTGASLELVGWAWDSVPQPQDDTTETGKLVFEITIDDLGEIIAVKTLEKTVSPLVEQIYKDAVAKLTFSKTTQNRAYAPTSVGKVTFIIQAK